MLKMCPEILVYYDSHHNCKDVAEQTHGWDEKSNHNIDAC